MVDTKTHKAFVEGGHIFEIEDGEIVDVEGPGYHGYIMCIVCKESECYACEPDFQNQICEQRVDQPTIPGLEYFQEQT